MPDQVTKNNAMSILSKFKQNLCTPLKSPSYKFVDRNRQKSFFSYKPVINALIKTIKEDPQRNKIDIVREFFRQIEELQNFSFPDYYHQKYKNIEKQINQCRQKEYIGSFLICTRQNNCQFIFKGRNYSQNPYNTKINSISSKYIRSIISS